MSTDTHARQPAGTPAGGQFAATAKTEPDVALTGRAHPTALGLGTDVRTKSHALHGEVTAVHSGCPMGAAQVMCQEVPIRPEALEDGYPWYSVRVHGGGAAYVPHYEVIDPAPEPAATGPVADLDRAMDAMRKAKETSAKAVSHLVAAAILEAEPDAAFLELDETETECGLRVYAGRVLDADREVLHEDVEDIELPEGTATGLLYDEVSELTGYFESADHAKWCEAVYDPNERPDGRRVRLPGTVIDLKAAKALYPEGHFS